MSKPQLFTQIHNGLMFDASEHFYPSRSYGCVGESLSFQETTNHYFGFVLSGSAKLQAPKSLGNIEIPALSYFSLPGPVRIQASGPVIVFERCGYRGFSMMGGPIEPMGRLSYIDQCTTSLIVPPARMTDACLNQLVFPPKIHQTQHTHPTIRLGLVYQGHGICHLPNQKIELSPGTAFHLPSHQPHCFESLNENFGVIAFHPDTDTGPSDSSHPMLNRTYITK